MNLRELWFGTRTEQHASSQQLALLSPWDANRALTSPDNFDKLSEEGYERNVIGYACVNTIADSVSEAPLRCRRLKDNDDSDLLPNDHPLVMLLDRPNDDEDSFEFFQHLLIRYLIAGQHYVHKLRARGGGVGGLRNLRRDTIKQVRDKSGKLLRYEYWLAGMKQNDIAPEDIIAIRRIHPRYDFEGLSPLSPAARSVDLDNVGSDFFRSVLNNGGMVRLLIMLMRKSTKEERESIKFQYMDSNSNAAGWGSPYVLDENAKIEKVGMTPEDANTENLFGHTESRICAAYGVPPIIVAAKVGLDRATYSNYEQAVKSLWQQTLTPLYARLASKFTRFLAMKEFGEDLFCEFDLANVQALQEDADKLSERMRGEYTAGLRTKNEAREALGLKRKSGGDTFKEGLDSVNEDAGDDDEPIPPMSRPAGKELATVRDAVRGELERRAA